jgi:glyoxylase-like metal-dependent hydrolase (beta-lactamase superfamily II)
MAGARLHQVAPDVLVQTSDIYMTNTTVIVGGSRCLLIDPGLLPTDLMALEEALHDLGLTVEAAVATHPHWDHVLWSAGLGEAPRFASAAAVEALTQRRSELVDTPLNGLGERWYVRWEASLVGRLTAIPPDSQVPWSGPVARLVTHDAHAVGHSAVHIPELGVVAAGDMVSDVEVPGIDWDHPQGLALYRQGLDVLSELDGLGLVIPGHGRTGDAEAWRRRLQADRHYLDALAGGEPIHDARLEGWPPQRQQHQANLDGLKRLTSS